jgi:hypothetical protein
MAILPPEKLMPVAELDAYLMDPTPYKWAELLAPFCPPLPREGQVILASYFGDAFVEDNDGAVWWVNGLEARVDRIAINREHALKRIGKDALVTLKTRLMEQLIVADMLLPVGMLYGLKTPRSEGGRYHPDNVGTAPVADAFAFLGDHFRRKNTQPSKAPEAAATAAPASRKKQKSGSRSGFWGKKK